MGPERYRSDATLLDGPGMNALLHTHQRQAVVPTMTGAYIWEVDDGPTVELASPPLHLQQRFHHQKGKLGAAGCASIKVEASCCAAALAVEHRGLSTHPAWLSIATRPHSATVGLAVTSIHGKVAQPANSPTLATCSSSSARCTGSAYAAAPDGHCMGSQQACWRKR